MVPKMVFNSKKITKSWLQIQRLAAMAKTEITYPKNVGAYAAMNFT